MTLEEMKERYDKFSAFEDFYPVSSMKAAGCIPVAFIDYFPDRCSCGSERIISINLKQMQCADPKCPIKQALGLANLFSNFGCKGIGEAVCVRAYNEIQAINRRRIDAGEPSLLHTNSYVEIFNLKSSDFSTDFSLSAAGDLFLRYVEFIKQSVMTFPEMVGRLGLPELDTSVAKLFDGINSFTELKTLLAEEGINNFCENRGFHDPMKKYWLWVSLEDIAVASIIFKNSIRCVGLQNEQICITGSLSPGGQRMTKKDFVEYCNLKAFTRSLKELVIESLKESGITKFTKDDATRILEKHGITTIVDNDGISLADFISIVEANENLSQMVQILEIRMSTAKMSAVHIIADYPSGTDKYKTGLARGVEKDFYGNERKVLITSDEYLAEIERRKIEWEHQYKRELRNMMTSSSCSTPLESLKKMEIL